MSAEAFWRQLVMGLAAVSDSLGVSQDVYRYSTICIPSHRKRVECLGGLSREPQVPASACASAECVRIEC